MSCLLVAKRPWIYARAAHSSRAQQHQPLSVNLQSLLDRKYGWMKMLNPSRHLWPYCHCYLHRYTPFLHSPILQRDEPDTVTHQPVRHQPTVICTSTVNSNIILPRTSQFSEMRTAIGNSALHDHEYRESLIACHWPSFCTLVLSHFAPGTSCISCLVPLAFRISCFSIWCCILFAFCTWYTYIWYSQILLYFKHLTSSMLCLRLVLTFYKFTPIMCSNRGSQREGMQECS
ncbi:hypothetical protein EV401DRAFT_2024198 [Pisolithus croceorrhizus]|nr:hypothetical protein EV401DRAFT_2024198 [Pisolithus croceorrhizus]